MTEKEELEHLREVMKLLQIGLNNSSDFNALVTFLIKNYEMSKTNRTN